MDTLQSDQLRVMSASTLMITPDASKGGMLFAMEQLSAALPKVCLSLFSPDTLELACHIVCHVCVI